MALIGLFELFQTELTVELNQLQHRAERYSCRQWVQNEAIARAKPAVIVVVQES